MCTKKKINKDNKENISDLFEKYEEEIYESSETNNELIKRILKREEQFLNTLTEEQREEYEIINDLRLQNYYETDKNIFKFGFSLATRLILESID